MATHPPDPCLVHRLPPAPNFVGREPELKELCRLWQSGFLGVLALVGLGGAGKTAVAARFLEQLLERNGKPRPEGLFVWSFYQEPDAGLFLHEAHHYFSRSGTTTTPAKGAGLLHLLRDALTAGGPHLIVLDGMERVQRQESASTETFGQVEDPLLKGLLTRIAEGMGRTTVLATSRFPLSDLQPFLGQGYRHLDIGGLGSSAALALLRYRGVRGDDAALEALIENYGAHALTLDHLGGLIGQFLGGDPHRAPELPALATPSSDRQAYRLARLLRAYEEHLPPAELTLLCRLCLLRRSVSEEQILQLFLCSPAVHARTIRELGDLIVRLPGADPYSKHDRQDLAESIRGTLEEALCAAPIAGPEETFRQEIRHVAEQVFAEPAATVSGDLEGFVRPYASAAHELPSDQLPLSAADREVLCRLYSRYQELREHPLFRSQAPPTVLEQAFKTLGYAQKPKGGPPPDLSAADVHTAFRTVQSQLRHLIYKHVALQRVRQL